MADTLKKLGAGAITTSQTVFYQTPASKKTIVKNITLCNFGTTEASVTISIDSTYLMYQYKIKSYETYIIPLSLIMESNSQLKGFLQTEAYVNYYISGIEVD